MNNMIPPSVGNNGEDESLPLGDVIYQQIMTEVTSVLRVILLKWRDWMNTQGMRMVEVPTLDDVNNVQDLLQKMGYNPNISQQEEEEDGNENDTE